MQPVLWQIASPHADRIRSWRRDRQAPTSRPSGDVLPRVVLGDLRCWFPIHQFTTLKPGGGAGAEVGDFGAPAAGAGVIAPPDC